MIEEKAVVVHADDQWLQVRVSGEEACETCDLAEQCYRDGGLLKIARKHILGPLVQASGEADKLKPGRTIKLTMKHTSLLSLTGVVYGVPLLLFAVGLTVGYYLLLPEAGEAGRALGSFAAGLGLVALAWLPIYRLDRRMARRIRYWVELPEDEKNVSEEDYYQREYSSGE
ncbi:MAG: SoxR reducing system RseC family protein [Spirochaetota bacterium]